MCIRDRHIGVMFDFVQIEVVFVIVMGAFIGVQIMLQIIDVYKRQTLSLWQGLYKVINEYLDSVTLQDLIDSDMELSLIHIYIADKYDVDSDKSNGRANERIKKSTLDRLTSTTTDLSLIHI